MANTTEGHVYSDQSTRYGLSAERISNIKSVLKASKMHHLQFNRWALSIALLATYTTLVYSLLTTPSGISFGTNRTLPLKQSPQSDQTSHQNVSLPAIKSPATNSSRLSLNTTKPIQPVASSSNNCSSICSPVELSNILQKLVQEDGTLHHLKELTRTSVSRNNSDSVGNVIRPECFQQLLDLIRGLASNELEMKTMLEFASDTTPSQSRIQLFKNKTIALNSTRSRSGNNSGVYAPKVSFAQLRSMQTSLFTANRSCNDEGAKDGNKVQAAVVQGGEDPINHEVIEKNRVLPKLIASVDHWINTLERFTLTKEWASLLKVFKGSESILGMFASTATANPLPKSLISANITDISLKNNSGLPTNQSVADKTSELVDKLKDHLPAQVLALTTSLNNLFPWHVWPWNNLDLYTTIDTFLNHGIFAFSKTTIGPERRIDLLPDMLRTLFNSLKYDAFPKKCTDWSKIICDRNSFNDRLVVAASADESAASLKEREERVKELSSVPKNQLTQELTCIMFSSLSMQHFGGGDQATKLEQIDSPLTTKLPWDKQIQKALKLYSLSRVALTDEQWMSLYDLLRELWSQQKVSDRVIMVSRVIQLLSSCHMPKEMLESALWKDIYKYKNALNQLIDIVIEELNRSSETGQLTIQQIALGSPHLHEIFKRFVALLPTLIDSLSHTVVDDLPELVNRFLYEKASFFKIPCKGYSFSDIITSLSKHKEEVVKLESMICQQTHTKPNITMMQINNLTNDFLAMALNLTTFGNTLALPKLLTNLETTPPKQDKQINSSLSQDEQDSYSKQNVTSIVDELAANPRLNKIVAILQSSPLDPPEVHAELPELDWVEAGTSVALFHESIQRLLSYEGSFTIFPEIENFQSDIKSHVDSSQQLFKKFSKRDPIRLVAYSLDVVMPVALRTFKPMDSFHSECISSFRDIFSEDIEGKSTRQWQCLVSSMNFASWALNNFMKTFNNMFRNILEQMSKEASIRNKRLMSSEQKAANTCIFFDGSVSMMLDNLPQFIDLALETVLMASTNSDQQLTLYDIMCSSNYMLDPFNELSIELKARMKDKMCHLFHKNSLANCADVLKLDQWTSTMRELNSSWFESNALSIKPSFRDITLNAHEFLELFGQFKPSTMSDSLIGRVLNVNSFWMNLLNRTMGIIDKYQEKRFEYALQTLTPIIYDNLPTSSNSEDVVDISVKEVRGTLITTILGAKAILNYLDKQSNNSSSNGAATSNNQFEAQIQTLFNWTDQYSLITAETLLNTLANNITKLEDIFRVNGTTFAGAGYKMNATVFDRSRITLEETWRRFCSSPMDKYLYFEVNTAAEMNSSSTQKQNKTDSIYEQMNEGKEVICRFQWQAFYDQLSADSTKSLAEYPEKQLTRIALTKLGQVLDMMFIESKHMKQLPKFFYMDYWGSFRVKLPQISPLKDQPSNLVWIWKGFERIVNAMDAGTNQTSKSLLRILDQLNCGLDAVKGGLSWENIGNIYQDKQDILAAHSTINNGFALASIGVNTFLAHKKFQRFLDEFIKPRVGLNAFCEMRDKNRLENIFSIPEGQDFLEALESFQELICDTNFETLAQNINPISVCYQTSSFNHQNLTSTSKASSTHPLADIMDRFFKLASLAVLDAKLVVASDAKPPILDKNQWQEFWNWWSDKAEPQPKSSLALTIVRAFQTLDSVNSNHVVWKALFRSIHEVCEIASYLLRAVEKRHQEVDMIGAASRLSLVKEAASQIDTAIRANGGGGVSQQQQLASTLSNIIFPEVNNFISFRTFKQLRYIKSISDYFSSTKSAQESICGNNSLLTDRAEIWRRQSRIELIGYKLNTNERLFSLLCHYHSSQWLTALNIVISSRTPSIPKKVNLMTKYLSIFTRNYKDIENLEGFIHGQQLENIENVANTTVSYFVTASHSLKSLSISKISNVSWHSLPNLLDSIDRHMCATKYEQGTFHIPAYEPKKPELEVLVCRMPQWNVTQVYSYLSENFDLQNMISLLTQQNNNSSTTTTLDSSLSNQTRTCVTPFKFASRWLKIGQETVDDMMSKSSRDKLRKCLSLSRKGQSIYSQSLRYVKLINSLLASINDLSLNDSWHVVKKTWGSISYIILDQMPSYTSRIY